MGGREVTVSTADVTTQAASEVSRGAVDTKLEVVVLPVADVDGFQQVPRGVDRRRQQ
jgi:hypothetical protein